MDLAHCWRGPRNADYVGPGCLQSSCHLRWGVASFLPAQCQGCLRACGWVHAWSTDCSTDCLLLQEVQALAAVGAHQNIVQYYSAWAEPDMQVRSGTAARSPGLEAAADRADTQQAHGSCWGAVVAACVMTAHACLCVHP